MMESVYKHIFPLQDGAYVVHTVIVDGSGFVIEGLNYTPPHSMDVSFNSGES